MTRQQRIVDDFNARFPVGTEVRYWPGTRDGDGKVGKTESKAQLLAGHTPVVWIEGARGCVGLANVEALDE